MWRGVMHTPGVEFFTLCRLLYWRCCNNDSEGESERRDVRGVCVEETQAGGKGWGKGSRTNL